MRMKWIAATAITASLAVSGAFLTANPLIRMILVLVGVYALWFVFTRPTRDQATT
jgi:membrane-bound ClpP family serine protease